MKGFSDASYIESSFPKLPWRNFTSFQIGSPAAPAGACTGNMVRRASDWFRGRPGRSGFAWHRPSVRLGAGPRVNVHMYLCRGWSLTQPVA